MERHDTPGEIRRAIREAAAERARLHAQGARRPDAPPGALAAYAASRDFIDRATSPEALERLANGDADALEYATCFLEVYPFCPDSGFAVRDIAKALRRADLPEPFAARLREALLAVVRQTPRDEFRHLRALALKVADMPFLAALDALRETGDRVAAENAGILADYIARKWSEEA